MSAPRKTSVRSELISAISALNMPPNPTNIDTSKDPQGTWFLTDLDATAAHAVEHLNAALELLG